MMLKYRFKILIPHIKTQTRKQIYGDLLTDINTKQERIVQNKIPLRHYIKMITGRVGRHGEVESTSLY